MTERGVSLGAQPAKLKWMIAEVAATRIETPRVRVLKLRVPEWPGHLCGQHVDVRLTAEDGYQASRSYSISSPPEDELIELTVEAIEEGEVSPYLAHEVRPGDRFELRGPIGGYFVWRASLPGPLVLIAGGSGVAPLMAMLRHRARAGHGDPALLLYSSRSLEDVIYREELDALAAADPTLTVVHTLTRAQPEGWRGQRRRIDTAMLSELGVPALSEPNIYICGPTPLVESSAQSLVALGVPPHRIRTERFGPSGT